MTSSSFKTAILLLFSTASFLISCKDESVDLRFTPENGSAYELEIEKKSTADRGGEKQEHTQTVTWLLKPSGDSSKVAINARYERFGVLFRTAKDSLFAGTGAGAARIYTDSPFTIQRIWPAVKDESFTVHLNTLGGIDSFSSFSPLLAAMAKKVLGDSATSEQIARVWDIAAARFSASQVYDQLNPVLIKYPGTHLKAGDTLTHTYKEANGYGLVMVQMLRVAELNDQQVTFLIGGSGFTEETQGGKLKAEQQGKIIVDRQTGMLELAYIEEIIEGAIDNKPLKVNSVIRASCNKLP